MTMNDFHDAVKRGRAIVQEFLEGRFPRATIHSRPGGGVMGENDRWQVTREGWENPFRIQVTERTLSDPDGALAARLATLDQDWIHTAGTRNEWLLLTFDVLRKEPEEWRDR
jgi:hypothetical protein